MHSELGFYINPHAANRMDVMQALAVNGIHCIGIDGSSWAVDRDESEMTQFHNELNEHGLKLCSLHSSFGVLAVPALPMPDDLFAAISRELRKAQFLGCRNVVYHSCHFRDLDLERSDEAIESAKKEVFIRNYIDAIRRIGDYAAKVGVHAAFENVYVSKYSASFELLIRVLTEAASPNTGICLDTGHALLADTDSAETIRRIGGLLIDTHFHDNYARAFLPSFGVNHQASYRHDLHLPPGLGIINWADVCRALEETGYSSPVLFEGVLGPGNSIEKGYFTGRLSYEDIIRITVQNWRAFELLGCS